MSRLPEDMSDKITGEFRRKLGTACRHCKDRKIRCDIADAGPCTPCSKSGTECCQVERQQKRRRMTENEPNDRQRLIPTISPTTPIERVQASSLPSPQDSRDETLNRFYERGIGARHWDVFHETDPLRIIYVGDRTANLHHLVQAKAPADHLHFPFPPIRPLLPWQPDPRRATTGGYLTSAVVQDLASFPTRSVRDALVQTYFDDIHPWFPIVDVAEFKRQYESSQDPPPLLLFHSVLLAAARISDHPMVASSRPTVTATLFRRAKSLFDLRHENDRVFLVQAALLIAWHVEDSDTISSNSYHWVGQATRIALGLGMHRDLTGRSTTLMPGFDRRHYRRLWWLVLQAETMISLEHGRPSMIRPEDYDQPPLALDEFRNFDDSPDSLICSDYLLINSELCEIALHVMALNAPNPRSHDSSKIDEGLARLALRLPRIHDFWVCQLRISYSLVILVMHRNGRTPDSAIISREAASTILTTFETMLSAGTLRRCSFNCSTPLLAAAIHFFQDVKAAIAATSFMRANAAHAQLERLLRPADELSKYWPHVEALAKLCISLHTRALVMIGDAAAQQRGVQQQADALAQIDISWRDIVAGYELPDLRQSLDVEEWMYPL
ncbi:hypothetical protein LTR53_013137 [Teratosphaeriaceae sp. CCFEE 6253]|nr:hypothetical protein LTR53_013137 [Teratosphaeriaceae sp. CCFEE 6253]